MSLEPAWHRDAACREHPELDWFPERGKPVTELKQICAGCLVRAECLDHALTHPERFGVWGGHAIRNRVREKRIRRKDPS